MNSLYFIEEKDQGQNMKMHFDKYLNRMKKEDRIDSQEVNIAPK